MTIQTTLHIAVQKLIKNRITSPHLDAEILLCYVLQKKTAPKALQACRALGAGSWASARTREYLFTNPEQKLTKLEISNYKKLINKRIKGEPVAYLTKHKQFYGLDFYVNKNVLIPRPETELMVEHITHNMEHITRNTQHITHNMKRITFIDVGTGSGCIIISIINQLRITNYELQNFQFFGTDISRPALAVARKNAKIHNVYKQIKFLQGDLLNPILLKSKILNLKSKIIITANLPYLTPAQIKNSPTIQNEPKLALTAGPDGLKYYRKLFKQINVMCSMLRVQCYVLCEIDPGQTNKIKQLIKDELPLSQIKIKKDFAVLDRLVVVRIHLPALYPLIL